MSSSVPAPSPCRLHPEHLRGLLVHVDAEEVSLRNSLRLLEDVPVDSLDETKQREVRVRIDQSLQHAALLTQNRIQVTSALGQFLGMPPGEVTFTALLRNATPAAAALLIPARQRLQRLVRQVQAAASSAAWIIGESRRIHVSLFDALPGTTSSDRYDAAGQRHLDPASLRFEARS
jgi:hypothetical protein